MSNQWENKTIYEQSQGKNIISIQFIVWKSHKQSWPAPNDRAARSDGDETNTMGRTSAELHTEQRNGN